MMDGSLADARTALRGLRRTPGFALAAILTLALGIGLATAVFTVADALLLRELPVRDQDRLVTLWGEKPDGSFDNFPLPLEDARDFARHARSLERVAAYSYYGAIEKPVREGDRITRLRRSQVSGDFFDVLGARPVLGRALRETDGVRGATPVIVLGYATWKNRFGGDPGVLGRRVVAHDEGVAYTVVGVMPQGLELPRGTEAWTPIVAPAPGDESEVIVDLVARLAPGATPASARDELTAYFTRADAPPSWRDVRGVVHTLPRLVLGETRPALLAFAAAAALLLLITCINVANLLFVRGLARVREIAVRSALGASRRRIVRQLLAENALLAAAGGVLGVAVAAGAVGAFVHFAPSGVPRLDEIGVNATALIGAVAITGVALLVSGLAPALIT
jgi:predicted permease